MTLGVKAKLALKKATTWGTEVTLGANDRMPFIRDTTDPKRFMIPDETLSGAETRAPAQRGDLDVNPSMEYHSDYRQWGLARALIMGTAGVPDTIEAVHAFLHKLRIGATLGLFASYGKDDSVEAFTLGSWKPDVLNIVSEQGGEMREILTAIAGVLDEAGVSSSAWTFTEDPSDQGARIIKHRQGVFRCNAAAGGALGSGDVLYPVRFELNINRSLEGRAGMNDNVEPVAASSSWLEITGSFDFDEYTAAHHALFYDAMKGGEAGTSLKFDYLFTGVVIDDAASDTYQSNFYVPAMRITAAPREIPGPGKLPARVEFEVFKQSSASAPTGFPTGYVEQLIWEIQNGDSADYLA